MVALRKNETAGFLKQVEREDFQKPVRVVEGGEHRQDSVANALAALNAAPDDIVLVHDAVRPFVDEETITGVIEAVKKYGAAIAGVPAVDTVKQVDRTADGAVVLATVPRERMVLAQTPQGFRFGLLKKAFDEATADGFLGTDEASLIERARRHGARGDGIAAQFEDHHSRPTWNWLSSSWRRKTAARRASKDRARVSFNTQVVRVPRIGFGWDSHEFKAGIPLKIGGVLLPHDSGLAGHSDGDVLLHALTDALLGRRGRGRYRKLLPAQRSAVEGRRLGRVSARSDEANRQERLHGGERGLHSDPRRAKDRPPCQGDSAECCRVAGGQT